MWRPLASLAREPTFGLFTPDSAGPRRAATIDSLADFSQVRWYVLRPAPVSFPFYLPFCRNIRTKENQAVSLRHRGYDLWN